MKKRFIFMFLVGIYIFGMVPNAAMASYDETVYRHNLAIYNSKAADEATFEYYRQLFRTDDDEVIRLAGVITEGLERDYDKIEAIHIWVADNIWYDNDAANDPSQAAKPMSMVLEERRGVCSGYAMLTAVLITSVGIPAKYVTGYAASEFHAWTEAFADDRWIILDTTWDSQNSYKNGVYSPRQANKGKYFDISLQEISKSHKYDDYNDYSLVDGFLIINGTYELQGLFNYYEKDALTEVTIPDGVKKIGISAFADCNNLTAVTIPSSVKSIGDFAFYRCPNLSVAVVPDSVAQIGVNAFGWNGSLTNLTMYGSLGSYAEYYAEEYAIPFVPDTLELQLPSPWATEAVSAAIAAGLVPKSLQYKYTQAITRAEFCALGVSLCEIVTGQEINGRTAFRDTFNVNVAKMASLGVVTGVGGGRFEPNAALTREQAATMLARLSAALERPLDAATPTFADNSSISSWASDAVGQIQSAGIMNGTGGNQFNPSGNYTREQSIITIMRMFEFFT